MLIQFIEMDFIEIKNPGVFNMLSCFYSLKKKGVVFSSRVGEGAMV